MGRESKEVREKRFIERAKSIHGDKYDYNLVNYIDYRTSVEIICKEHGIFKQTPQVHLKGGNCPYCKDVGKITNEIFIKRAKEIHGNKYDYSKTIYKSTEEKVVVICKKHGEFLVTPHSHLRGVNCLECSKEIRGLKCRKPKDQWIKEFNEVHNNFYDYSKIETIDNAFVKIIIICPKHGEFISKPNQHQQGNGCRLCGINKVSNIRRKSKNEWLKNFIEKHEDRYDYSLINDIKSSNNLIPIICKEHGMFHQTVISHSLGMGCRKCAGTSTYTTEEFIEKAQKVHSNKYDYSKVNYIRSNQKVIIICKEHGEFLQIPNNHLNGQNCPNCKNSSLEDIVRNYLINKNIIFKKEYNIKVYSKRGLYLDFYYEKDNKKFAIECQGLQHYEPINYFGGEKSFLLQKKKDECKKQYCKENEIKLFEIPYWFSKEEIEKFLDTIL